MSPAGLVLAMLSVVQGPAAASTVVIEGTIVSSNRLGWLERPFEVPAGTARIDIEASFTDRGNGTALEFGLYDPERFRGASRFSKSRFFVGRTAATPSYQPGYLQPGVWRLLIGVPSIREGGTSSYRVVIRLTPEAAPSPPPAAVPETAATKGPRWYQGDLHAHTMHSDAFGCADGRGGSGPCATHQVVDAAARLGLDFVAVTDHNTTSHHHDLAGLQLLHDRLLLLRGQEVTTFYGHANVYGTSEVVDFRIGHRGIGAPEVLAQVRRLGGLLSINHPARETGDACTGCGWTAPGTDWRDVEAMEVVNNVTLTGPAAGLPFWHARLNEGYRITGVGGSDDHGASTRAGSAVGIPTTVIASEALSESGLLAGIRAGRVYIKTRGPEGPDIRFDAPGLGATMGDAVSLPEGQVQVAFRVEVARGHGQHVEVIRNGEVVPGAVAGPINGAAATAAFTVAVSRGDWVRINLRDAAGVTVVGNPIYFR